MHDTTTLRRSLSHALTALALVLGAMVLCPAVADAQSPYGDPQSWGFDTCDFPCGSSSSSSSGLFDFSDASNVLSITSTIYMIGSAPWLVTDLIYALDERWQRGAGAVLELIYGALGVGLGVSTIAIGADEDDMTAVGLGVGATALGAFTAVHGGLSIGLGGADGRGDVEVGLTGTGVQVSGRF
jgi:hypothetical protein